MWDLYDHVDFRSTSFEMGLTGWEICTVMYDLSSIGIEIGLTLGICGASGPLGLRWVSWDRRAMLLYGTSVPLALKYASHVECMLSCGMSVP